MCIHEVIRLITMTLKDKNKNRSQKFDINIPRSRHGYKCNKYINCLVMMMLICTKPLIFIS